MVILDNTLGDVAFNRYRAERQITSRFDVPESLPPVDHQPPRSSRDMFEVNVTITQSL